ncbi:hypothetical protein MTR67_003355 [Solanum verrucosum]|uniref:Tf2-1-like SH3-like domain-containing protein n=1 Tax=Solanum verrucosum TaxID=315347 RepID=A0AAF0TE20_SOLVR|nr:hypothetical protein MTR67_003355 [Solanum verrucosum]
MKEVMRFGKKGKLSPRYIRPYRIVKRVGNVAYELELPQELAAVHPVFHISMLKKSIGDPSLIIPTENIGINDSLSYEEIPVQILDRQVRRLRTKDVASVKVLWRNQLVEEATWEAEEEMKKRYPYLFESGGNADQAHCPDRALHHETSPHSFFINITTTKQMEAQRDVAKIGSKGFALIDKYFGKSETIFLEATAGTRFWVTQQSYHYHYYSPRVYRAIPSIKKRSYHCSNYVLFVPPLALAKNPNFSDAKACKTTEMDVGTRPPIILANEILKRTKSNKRVLWNARRLTTDFEVLNWINGAPDADPSYLDLHHKMMQAN